MNNNNEKKASTKPITKNTENVGYENHRDPCGCRCTWYSEKGRGRKHREVSERATMKEIRKICMLGSARILGKMLRI